MQIPCLLGGPGRRERPKVGNLVKMVEVCGIPPILVISTKKAPGTVFLVKIHTGTHFSVSGIPKKHRKSIGFVGVSTPGPPGHHFHPTELKMVLNHHISMKCGEIPPISTKVG